jgi:hypothetical protein
LNGEYGAQRAVFAEYPSGIFRETRCRLKTAGGEAEVKIRVTRRPGADTATDFHAAQYPAIPKFNFERNIMMNRLHTARRRHLTRRVIALGLAVLMTAALTLAAYAAGQTASPTKSKVLVDGKDVSFDAYNISDNNYFKLRDLAYALNGTKKQFAVGYDAATKAITLTSGAAYAPVGGEMTGKGDGAKTPTPTASKIYLDGKEVSFTVYIIEGNNYFKLRDVGEAFNFGVDWDGANQAIVIDTGKGYTPDAPSTTPPPANVSLHRFRREQKDISDQLGQLRRNITKHQSQLQ